MAEHTPGPWKAPMMHGEAGPTTGYVWAEEPHGGPVAVVCHTVANPDIAMTANARLIAAAPDMLAVLRRVDDNLSLYGRDQVKEAARAAIAKAEGRDDA